MRTPDWGGDPSIAWRILLSCVPAVELSVEELSQRQHELHRSQDWPRALPVVVGQPLAVDRQVAEVRDEPLVLGVAGPRLVISAFHAYVDGLGLLEVLAALTGSPATSSARGVGERPVTRGGTLQRIRELAFAPPARVATSPVTATEGDAMASVAIDGRISTSRLIGSVVAAVVEHNAELGHASRHLTVAVGAGRPSDAGEPIRNRSELIRLRDLETLPRRAVGEALRSAPLNPAGGTGGGGGRLTSLALRALAPRLGSTLLVSHLGEVSTLGASGLAFYPVTAGGTGLSLGAVGHRGRTVLTLRGRGSAWDEDGLHRLLVRITR